MSARPLPPRQRRRNLRVARVRPVLFSVHQIFVDRGVKGFLHLAGRAGELQHGSSFGRAHAKSVRLQPRRDGLEVLSAGPNCRPYCSGVSHW